MVKKNKELEKKFINLEYNLEEDFIKPNEFLVNDVLNEEEENFPIDYEQRDDDLIEKLKSLDGKRSKRLRTEVVKNELDVNITSKHDPNSVQKIKAYELLNSLKDVSEAGVLKKLFSKAQKRTKVLETPLPKYLSEKAERIASYNEDKKEISKWDPVIKRNRMSEQLVFPLKQPDYSMQSASNFSKTWKAETELEKEVAQLLGSSENNLKDQKLLTPAEIKALQSVSLEEMKQKRAEFLKLRALQSYQEAKFKRLKNIKSKRYRRILKKEKQKEEKKEMENVEKEDPVKFKEVIEQMEKDRIKERMSLKHKNTSKWAKQKAIYSKFNEHARDQVQEQLEISKNLTKKRKPLEVDSEVEENEAENEVKIDLGTSLSGNNPWLKMMKGVGGEKNNQKEESQDEKNMDEYSKPSVFADRKEIEKAQKDLDNLDSDESDLDEQIDRSNIEDVVHILKDEASDTETPIESKEKKKPEVKIITTPESSFTKPIEVEIDDKNEKRIESKNIVPIDKDIEFKQLESDNNRAKISKNNKISLSEAFEDDDVVEEFKAEKDAVVEREKVKAIDLTMPGWGGWAGAGIDPEEAKKKMLKRGKRKGKKNFRKLIIRPNEVLKTKEDKEQMIRKDQNLKHVIISEKKDTKIAQFQISQLPHQFSSVHDFEAKISQPIGRTWNPDFKFKKLIKPKIKTKLGSIIEPIDKDDCPKKFKKSKK